MSTCCASRRADADEHGGQLAPERRAASLGSCRRRSMLGHDGVAVTRERAGSRVGQLGPRRAHRTAASIELSARDQAARSRIASRATSRSGSAISARQQVARTRPARAPSTPRRLGALAHARRPRRADHRLEDHAARRRGSATGRARRGTPPARRGSRSPRSRRALRSAPADRRPARGSGTAAPRSARRGRGRGAARPRRGRDRPVAGGAQQRERAPPDVRVRDASAARAAPGASSGCAALRAGSSA